MNFKKIMSMLLCLILIFTGTGVATVSAVEKNTNHSEVLFDFEYVTGEENKGADNYISSFTLPTYSATWLSENNNGGYSSRAELAEALYEQDIPLYMWPNAAVRDSTNTSATATVVSAADGEPVRFGDKSLRIDLDFSNFNKQSNANFYLRTTAPTYKFEGSPTAIGVWVYAPEGTTNYLLFLQCAGKVDLIEGTSVSSYQCLTTPEAMGTEDRGISWTGWRYLEFDLTGTKGYTIVSSVGENYRPYGQRIDNGVFWISYQPYNMGVDVTSDTIYIDNITLIYGDDTTNSHSYAAVVTAPTCTEQGYTTYTCECGDSYVADYVDATGHSYTAKITTPATHIAEGVKTFTCKCGDSYTESIEKIAEHTFKAVVTAPTCTEQGYTTHVCACGDSYVTDYVDATGHFDFTNDNKCDLCGDPEVCMCNCHSENSFVSFFQKIIRFLRSLLGLKFCRQCKCPYT